MALEVVNMAEVESDVTDHIRELGDFALDEAIRLCPVDTGRLVSSLERSNGDEGDVFIGSDVDYAWYVEMGHFTVPNKHGHRTWVPPQPYLRPALDVIGSF